jgi:hypothetical protein
MKKDMYKRVVESVGKCGCVYEDHISEDGRNFFTIMTHCKCQKHYDEQSSPVSWIDEKGIEQVREHRAVPFLQLEKVTT